MTQKAFTRYFLWKKEPFLSKFNQNRENNHIITSIKQINISPWECVSCALQQKSLQKKDQFYFVFIFRLWNMAKTGLLSRVVMRGSTFRLNSFASAAAESIVRSSFQARVSAYLKIDSSLTRGHPISGNDHLWQAAIWLFIRCSRRSTLQEWVVVVLGSM